MQTAELTIYNNLHEAEKARLQSAAQSTYTERFYTLMKLIKVSKMIRKAKIISAPEIPSN